MTETSENKTIGTIRQVVKWTEQDGWPISETTIRRMIATGAPFKHFKSGTRNYINYPSLCDYIGMKPVEAPVGIPS